MVFVRDTGSVFEAPLERVWGYVGSGATHAQAHGHHVLSRERHSDASGTYAWEQPWDGAPCRFAMRWTTFWPLGLGYEVLDGPFEGSKFFLVYEPRGSRTAVEVVGEFLSPTLPTEKVTEAVLRFFSVEFEQDRIGLRTWKPPATPPR